MKKLWQWPMMLGLMMGMHALSLPAVETHPHTTAPSTEEIFTLSFKNETHLPSHHYDPSRAYTIRFNTRGGSTIRNLTQPAGTPLTPPVEPTKVGYTFGGWYETEWFIQPFDFTVMPSYNLTLYAKWDILHTTLTFDTAGGTAIDAITQAFGSDVVLVSPPTKEGHTFIGWHEPYPQTMPAEDKTLVALWRANAYTLSLDTAGGTAIDAITQTFGSDLVMPNPPTKEGHTFIGWHEPFPQTMPAEDKTLVALWRINPYTLTFNTAGGTSMPPITQVYGQVIDMPPPPTKEGSLFHGYSQPIPSTMPAVHTLIEVYWLRETHEICETLTVEAEGLLAAVSPHLPDDGSVEVILSVQRLSSTQPSHEMLEHLSKIITRHDRFAFYDIEVRIQEEGHEAMLLDELPQPIHLRLTLPKALQGFQTYRVVRMHQGEADVLETFFDETTQTLTFETDRFSTYAVVYDARGASWMWWILLLAPIPLLYLSVRYQTEILTVLDRRKSRAKVRQ